MYNQTVEGSPYPQVQAILLLQYIESLDIESLLTISKSHEVRWTRIQMYQKSDRPEDQKSEKKSDGPEVREEVRWTRSQRRSQMGNATTNNKN
ncbi:hypothetical protein BgiBS90_012752 [Biomphalaria glabrata]|nr:hypothetical protein BgiBS90_012752 [Biomphalaria glabrata]